MSDKVNKIFLFLLVTFTVWTAYVPRVLAVQEVKTRCENFLANFDVKVEGQPTVNPFSWIKVDLNRFCTVQGFLYWLLQMALAFAAGIAILFIVLGGYQYMTSAGNDEQAEKGRKTLTNAVIGLVVILLSIVIIRVVVSTITGGRGDTTTTTTQTSTSGGTNTATGNQGDNLPILGVASFSGAATAKITDSYIFTINVPKDLVASICQKQDPSFYGTVKDANGNIQNLQPSKTSDSQKYVLSFSVRPTEIGFVDKPNTPSDSQLDLGFTICGQNSDYTWSIPITYTTSGPRGTDNTDKITQAAANSSFTPVLSKDKKSININLNAATSDKMTLCGISSFSRLSEGSIEVFINGQKNNRWPASDSILIAYLTQPLSAAAAVRVDICGHTIGGGEKTVQP